MQPRLAEPATAATPLAAPSERPSAEAALAELLASLPQRRREFTALRHMPADVVEGFKRAGVYRALVPTWLGGDGLSPHAFCALIERIAAADGSAGWVASFGMGITYLASLPLPTLQEIYRDGPDVVFAAGIFPPQPAPQVEGGFEVSGRWSFASGCMGADVIGVGIVPAGGDAQPLPRIAVMPRDQLQIEPNWDVMGMVGTGSHDLRVDRVVVPQDWTFVRGAPSALQDPIFRYPTLSFATQVLSVVGLGIARAAIEELKGLATGRISVTGAPRTADRPLVQVEIAKAEAQLRAARAFFYEAIDAAWDTLQRGDAPTPEQISMLRLSSTHATRTSAEVARSVQMQAGMTGIYESSPLATHAKDTMVLTQHAFMGDITYQNAGAMLFGLKPLPGYL